MKNVCGVKGKTEVSQAAVIRKPGSSRENKTGSWRTFDPVVTDKCTGCGICSWYCPEHCIKIKNTGGRKKASIDLDYCKGCLICVNECPVKAVTVKKVCRSGAAGAHAANAGKVEGKG
jgi:pyruvate ferredoxin oxidoreductase delta subunit